MENDEAGEAASRAERALLGSVLIGGAATFAEVSDVQDRQFSIEPHRLVWLALSAIAGRGESPDLVLTVCELQQIGHLRAAGGAAFISSLVDGVPSVESAAQYAFLVKTYAIARRFRVSA